MATTALPGPSLRLKHFLRIAKRGQHGGASGGERRAAKLLESTMDAIPGLDDQAIAGFGELCLWLVNRTSEARELVEGDDVL